MSNSISVKNLFFNFNNGFSIDNLSVDFKKGEFTSILGQNGSGKTTLVKLLVRLLKQKKGELFLFDKNYSDISNKDFYKKVAFVPQTFSSVFPFSVFEIILMGRTPYLNYYGYENDNDIKKVKEVSEQLEISYLLKKSINEISGGELQRVIIARAIVQDTDILVLDEPNSHLDIKNQLFIFDILKSLNGNGKTIITISHDLELSMIYSQRIIFMKEGKIIFDGPPQAAFEKSVLSRVYDIDFDKISNKNIFNTSLIQ